MSNVIDVLLRSVDRPNLLLIRFRCTLLLQILLSLSSCCFDDDIGGAERNFIGIRVARAYQRYVQSSHFDTTQAECPIRVHSNRIPHFFGTSGSESDLPLQFGEFDGADEALPPAASRPTARGQHFVASPLNNTGMLFSEQLFPAEYGVIGDADSGSPINFKCQFVFLGAADEHVQIIFHKFRLYTSSLDGDDDTAEESESVKQQAVGAHSTDRRQSASSTSTPLRCEEEDRITAHVLVGSRMSKIHDFCGDELPPQLMSTRNLLTLEYVINGGGEGGRYDRMAAAAMHPDGSSSFGFEVEYRFLKDWGSQPPEAIPVPGSSCTFMFNGTQRTSGSLWSPNYPGFYPRNLDCQYIFHGLDTQIVLINFEYFDVEGLGQCEESTHSDFVLFSNYKTMDRTNRRYCGGTRPPRAAITSESNYFRMQFQSNDIFDGTGFYAHYQFYDQQSSQRNRVKLTSSSSSSLYNSQPTYYLYTSRWLIGMIPLLLYVHLFSQ